ncbi:uncharacterized protein F4822DRAFT_247238 [Hypoxylon trugodes]|uniref:uncharacterized protein n=1 Tax=Hypoxylon trugodes TaxID=326681 RepID=UPI00219F33EE|nr:uncharacterized protein F4822DRAFT_247238 [Hypoxylon trugodes]KAI1388446.1 hypothetical protein F4822DRAFT_247238 [Hypoxylon trugodes]
MILGSTRRHRRRMPYSERDDDVIANVNHSTNDERSPSPDISNPAKRSGTHNLNRNGYHEDKCRNVLVRYCAHVPRNYQYKDGIQQIFLILREHLGDENLDLAGGVLYELIEVDCDHTDDPGAAFQRWKYDHLRRYADLELPHVPHMTTITSTIIPTQKLAQWRLKHSRRYPFVLSDSSASIERASSIDPSCIRHRKTWLIDHTLYISSKGDGTRPLNSPNPKEFHEKQWSHEYGARGRLIEEREVPIISQDRPSNIPPPGTTDPLLDNSIYFKRLRRYYHKFGIFDKLKRKICVRSLKPEVEQRRHSWIPGGLMFESSFRGKLTGPENISTHPFPEGCEIPNAIFARKYLLIETSESLPLALSVKQMPTAESKAIDTIVQAVMDGSLIKANTWSFRGPFTPQLGFDGGLDYQWSPREPITTFRFDRNVSDQEDAGELGFDDRSEGYELDIIEDYADPQGTSTKRQGMVFGSGSGGGSKGVVQKQESTNYTTSNISISDNQGKDIPRVLSNAVYTPIARDQVPSSSSRLGLPLSESSQAKLSPTERSRRGARRKDPLLFKNVEFTTPTELDTSTSNRKITVIEISPNNSPQVPNRGFTR